MVVVHPTVTGPFYPGGFSAVDGTVVLDLDVLDFEKLLSLIVECMLASLFQRQWPEARERYRYRSRFFITWC